MHRFYHRLPNIGLSSCLLEFGPHKGTDKKTKKAVDREEEE